MSSTMKSKRPLLDFVADNLDGPASDMVVTIGIGKENLDPYLKPVGENVPRIKYLDGSLTLVSPSFRHEWASEKVDSVLIVTCDELDLVCISTCSTLYQLKRKDHGVEPGKSYYFGNWEKPAPALTEGDPVSFDLEIHQPRDLLLETIYGHFAKEALRIHRQLKAPEVWLDLVKKKSLVFLRIDKSAAYEPVSSSISFPILTPIDIIPWIVNPEFRGNFWSRRVTTRVREVIVPRLANRPC